MKKDNGELVNSYGGTGQRSVQLPCHGNSQYVSIFFIVAVFILVVACINFMNLATARSARRAKEVGLRKVVGAVRGQLIGQFLGESLLISFLALVLAIVIVSLSLPAFNILAEKDLHLHVADGTFWLSLIGIAALTGLLAGSYPALYLSGFQPVKVLKGTEGLRRFRTSPGARDDAPGEVHKIYGRKSRF